MQKDFSLKIIKTTSYIVTAFIFIAAVFAAVSLCIVFPVYFFAEKAPILYNAVIIGLILLACIGALITKTRTLYRRYQSGKAVAAHIGILYLLPLLHLVLLVIIEAVAYRFSFVIPFLFFIPMEIVVNAILLIITIYLYSYRNTIKKRLYRSVVNR